MRGPLLGGSFYQDGRKWLKCHMVNKSPKDQVLGPLPNGYSWRINGGDPNHLLAIMGWSSKCTSPQVGSGSVTEICLEQFRGAMTVVLIASLSFVWWVGVLKFTTYETVLQPFNVLGLETSLSKPFFQYLVRCEFGGSFRGVLTFDMIGRLYPYAAILSASRFEVGLGYLNTF